MAHCHCGPGFASPAAAVNGPKEKILYVTCAQATGLRGPKKDYLAVVNVDPNSRDYSKVIFRCQSLTSGDEFHHMGWNSCSSSYTDVGLQRNKLILPCLLSDRIYVLDTTNEVEPRVEYIIQNLKKDFKVTAPHTSHCLKTGEILISCLGDEEENAQGSFLLLDSRTYEVKGKWEESPAPFGYDFWYQPRHDVMVSTEWGAPSAWRKGFDPGDITKGKYGGCLNFWSWSRRKIIKQIYLGYDGLLPLEVRFMHNPDRAEGYVGCALSSTIFRFHKNTADGQWTAEKVIQVEPLQVTNWLLPVMPGLITFILLSMDDKFLYFSNWVQGDVRQYDISDTANPRLVGQVFLGGSMCRDSAVQIQNQEGPDRRPARPIIKSIPMRGGPQMLQLSLDGKRLYVTNSLYSQWDKQFYPEMVYKGGMMVQVDVDTVNGGLSLNPNFLVDFGQEPEGPVLCHEMRYPGGDCTSDIFV